MELLCQYCNKKYASYQSKCNHIKKYHKSESNLKSNQGNRENQEKCIFSEKSNHESNLESNHESSHHKNNINEDDNENKFLCRKCNKDFKFKQNRWRHEKTCKKNDELKDTNNNTEMKELKEQLKELTNILLNTIKIHPSKLKKLNNQLINNSNNINNNSNNNIGTINNINNNNIIIPLSQQNLVEVLKKSEKLNIISSGNLAHLKLTDLLYTNPAYEKYRTIYITNLSNDIGYIYDSKENRFIVKSKKDILDDFGTERFSDIELFYNELKDKISEEKLIKMKKMVKSYFDNKDFKEVKNKELLISLYNNKINVKKIYDKINTKEIEI